MVLMTSDHASGAFNAGHLMTDSVRSYSPGTVLPAGQFFARWVTHLCAPTFVFLAGTALALSVGRRQKAGEVGWGIDRFLISRGLFIAALDPLWMSWMWVPGKILFQVMYAIGMSMVAMSGLRRLPSRVLLVTSLAVIVFHEALGALVLSMTGPTPPVVVALLLTGGRLSWGIAAYPLLPWLAMMMLGWAFGTYVAGADRTRVERTLWTWGAAALGVFAVVRGLNGYGNMRLLRDDASIVQWLHVSKYPPSLSFTTLELGIMAVCLAGLFRVSRNGAPAWTKPLLVYGQTALFFYILHAHLLHYGAVALGRLETGGLVETYVATGVALAVLMPLCVAYGRYKRVHPNGIARYV
jgi:uncharacterized membrane protein